jgi:hypothetical protein
MEGWLTMSNQKILDVIFFILALTAINPVVAKDINNNYPDMEQMKEFLKGTGMSEEQINQMEGIMGNAAGKQAGHDAAIMEKKQREFEAAYGGNPAAQLEINDSKYTLRVTECKKYESGNLSGTFKMRAEQPPGEDDVSLGVSCCKAGLSGGGGSFVAPEGLTDGIPSHGSFDGKTYSWEGKVEVDGPEPEAYVKIKLSCEGVI